MSLVKGALTDFKNKFLTSIHGRKLGIDHQGFVVGHHGQRMPYEASTAASTLANYGTSVVSGSSADFTLNAPPSIGATKTIVNLSTLSTATMGVVRASSAEVNFGGSTAAGAPSGARINLVNSGASVQLLATSSNVWTPVGSAGYASSAQAYIAVTTSS